MFLPATTCSWGQCGVKFELIGWMRPNTLTSITIEIYLNWSVFMLDSSKTPLINFKLCRWIARNRISVEFGIELILFSIRNVYLVWFGERKVFINLIIRNYLILIGFKRVSMLLFHRTYRCIIIFNVNIINKRIGTLCKILCQLVTTLQISTNQ